MKKTISKCGARFSHKKEVEFLHGEKPINQVEKEKPIQKKRSWTRKTPKIETGDFANLENNNENEIGVSDSQI